MSASPKTIRIVIALIISGIFIGAGYYFSSPFHTTIVGAESTDQLLKEYAAKDTDSDGLPDWQESLYGTDPSNAHSADTTLTDGEAVQKGVIQPKFKSETPQPKEVLTKEDFDGVPAPADDSLTKRFSEQFIEGFFASGGQTLDDAGKQALIDSLLVSFTKEAGALVRSSYTATSVHTSASVTTQEYVAALGAVLNKYNTGSQSDTISSLSQDLVEKGDKTAATKLIGLSKDAAGAASDFSKMTVPPAFAAQHLTLIQSFDTSGKVAALMADYEKDPIASLGALAAYAPAASAVLDVWRALAKEVLLEGEPAPGTFAATIVDFSRTSPTP